MSIRTDVLFDIWCLYQSQRLLHIFIFTPIIQMRHERLIHKTEICLWSEYGWCFLQQIELLKTGKMSIHKRRNECIDKRSINTSRAFCALFETGVYSHHMKLSNLTQGEKRREEGTRKGREGAGMCEITARKWLTASSYSNMNGSNEHGIFLDMFCNIKCR